MFIDLPIAYALRMFNLLLVIVAFWRCIKLLRLTKLDFNVHYYRYRIATLTMVVLVFFSIIVMNNLIREQYQIETNTWLFFDILNTSLIYYNIENIYFTIKREGQDPHHKDVYAKFLKWRNGKN